MFSRIWVLHLALKSLNRKHRQQQQWDQYFKDAIL